MQRPDHKINSIQKESILRLKFDSRVDTMPRIFRESISKSLTD